MLGRTEHHGTRPTTLSQFLSLRMISVLTNLQDEERDARQQPSSNWAFGKSTRSPTKPIHDDESPHASPLKPEHDIPVSLEEFERYLTFNLAPSLLDT
jgi:hypothetical protein